MTYEGTKEGRRLLNPRSSITPTKLKDGSYLLLFSNNGDTEKFGYGRKTRLHTWLAVGRATEDSLYIEWT